MQKIVTWIKHDENNDVINVVSEVQLIVICETIINYIIPLQCNKVKSFVQVQE